MLTRVHALRALAAPNTVQDIGGLGGDEAGANGLNNKGAVVGWAETGVYFGGIYVQHAFLYTLRE